MRPIMMPAGGRAACVRAGRLQSPQGRDGGFSAHWMGCIDLTHTALGVCTLKAVCRYKDSKSLFALVLIESRVSAARPLHHLSAFIIKICND